MVTRRTRPGTLHGSEQQMSLDDAIKTHTISAARQLGRDKDLVSLAVGKRADLVELSADPHEVDSNKLTDQMKVLGTWVNGVKVDTGVFISKIEAVDSTEHKGLHQAALSHTC